MRWQPILGLVLALSAASGEWPQFLGPHRNGSTAIQVTPWAAGGPKVLWKKDAGAGFAAPVVEQGRVILFHRLGNKETVECLDAKSGTRIWSFDYPTSYRDDFGFDEGPRGTPAIAGGRVYTFGAEGMLHAIDFSSGKKVWGVDTYRQFGGRKGFFGAAGSPLVDGNRVFVIVGGASAGIAALDKDSGKTLWTATADEAGYSSPVIANIGGTSHALFFTRSGLVDADPANGKIRFQFPWRSRSHASVNAATPLSQGSQVFLSASYGTGAVLLDLAGGSPKPVWQSDDAMSNHYSTCVYRDGFLYGFHGRQEEGQDLRCVEWKTGKVRWSEDRFGAGTVTLAGDRLLVLRESGELVMAPASPDGFRPLCRAKLLAGTVRPYPALGEGGFFARNERTLVAVEMK